MFSPFFWRFYNKKCKERLDHLQFIGFFSLAEAKEKNMHLVIGSEGSFEEENYLKFYWLIDDSDGIIADAKFQAFGKTALLFAADIACELMIHKNYDQASRITAELIDQTLRGKKSISAFPKDCEGVLNYVLSAIDQAVSQCQDIPFATDYVSTPIGLGDLETQKEIENWSKFSKKEKLAVIEEVIDKQIRPFIELDAGGVKVLDIQGEKVFISYEGTCTSCFAATGSTLSAIQQILQSTIHPSLEVIPDL